MEILELLEKDVFTFLVAPLPISREIKESDVRNEKNSAKVKRIE